MVKHLFAIGRVVKSHGVKGKVKVEYFGEDLHLFSLYREIFIEGEGVIETEAFRELADWEVQQLTFVFPHLFADMEDAYRREFEPGSRGAGEPGNG